MPTLRSNEYRMKQKKPINLIPYLIILLIILLLNIHIVWKPYYVTDIIKIGQYGHGYSSDYVLKGSNINNITCTEGEWYREDLSCGFDTKTITILVMRDITKEGYCEIEYINYYPSLSWF